MKDIDYYEKQNKEVKKMKKKNNTVKKNIMALRDKVREKARSLSFYERYDWRVWKKLNSDTIREYLILTFNWKNSNPRKSTQHRLIDRLSQEQLDELSEILEFISTKAMLGWGTAKYIVL